MCALNRIVCGRDNNGKQQDAVHDALELCQMIKRQFLCTQISVAVPCTAALCFRRTQSTYWNSKSSRSEVRI